MFMGVLATGQVGELHVETFAGVEKDIWVNQLLLVAAREHWEAISTL